MYIYGKKQSKNKITSLHEMNYMTFTINDLWSSRQYQPYAITYVLIGFQWKKYGDYIKKFQCFMLSIRTIFFLEKMPSLSTRVYEHLQRVTILYGFKIKLILINERSKQLYPYNAYIYIQLSFLHYVTQAFNL